MMIQAEGCLNHLNWYVSCQYIKLEIQIDKSIAKELLDDKILKII